MYPPSRERKRAVMGIEENLALLLANGNQEPPPYEKHVSLVRRTSNTVFPTISNRNTAPCVEAMSEADLTPRADRGASGWLSLKGLQIRRFAWSLTQHSLPITGALQGFCRVIMGALSKGTRHTLSITCD
jgi:hypothetical protein